MMTRDAFQIAGVDRSPWVDSEALSGAHTARAAALHPDSGVGDGRAFDDWNWACRTLGDTKARLDHLLELETGAPQTGARALPQQHATFFFELADYCQSVGALARRLGACGSLLEKAILATEVVSAQGRWLPLHSRLLQLQAEVEKSCLSLHHRWMQGGRDYTAICETRDLAAYVSKWAAELERCRLGIEV